MLKELKLEFLCMFLLSFFSCCVRIQNKDIYSLIAIAYFFLYSSMIYALQGSCSCFFNPILTLSLALTKQIKFVKALIYSSVQMVAGLLGAYTASYLKINEDYSGEPEMRDNYQLVGASLELIGMFLLVWTYNSLSLNKKGPKHLFAVAFASIYMISSYTFGSISGGCLNYALYFGPAVVSLNFKDWSYYLVSHLIGGIVASILFLVLGREKEETEDLITELESKKIK